MIYGCKAEQGVRFCEGVNTEGKGVKCGSVFSAGELLLLINVKEEFGADRLTMNIYEKKKFKKEVFETRALNVKPEEMKTTADLKLYKEGEYVVDVTGRDNAVIARGEVKIVETY
jgi:hypothetical protein